MNMNYKDLPDFCNQDVVLNSMVMAEIIAILLTIVQPVNNIMDHVQYLAIASMVIQWILIINLVVLCKTQKYLTSLSPLIFYLIIFLLLQLVTFLVSLSGNYLINYLQLNFVFEDNWQIGFILQNLTISSLLSLILIRYAYLNQRWKNQVIRYNQSKVDALQAKIRPHFLFNSLNTIAALIHIDPQKADDAILGLSDIFRTSIKPNTFVTLKEEIDTVNKYLDLEKLRLEERLQVNWQIYTQDLSMKIPALILQPLVENAVYHGTEQLDEGGEIGIIINIKNNTLWIEVNNPVHIASKNNRSGNSIALANIKERLKLIYPSAPEFTYALNTQTQIFTSRFAITL